jgi:DNA-binding transcriptional MerR regulator
VNGERTYTIDEVEEATGFDRRTISYYVQQGLLPKVGRRGPRTRYSQLFVDRLRFIRMVRDLQDRGAVGTMTLSDFRNLFQSVPEESIAEAVASGEPTPVIARESYPAPDAPAMAAASDRGRQMARRDEGLRRAVADRPRSEPLETRRPTMDPTQETPPESEPEERLSERAYFSLPAAPRAAGRDSASGEHHRFTLDALNRSPEAPVLKRAAGARSPADDELREALARLSAVVRRQPRAYLRTTETWTRARVTEELSLSARSLQDRHLPLLERVAQILRRLLREGEDRF